ncbi:RNA polymerase III subunit RPC82-domain-containing protein [Mycena metata]|uniref:DNA-directed RNA polymerase III subunit RPC3 n=1 Tax=Mycena metata TaxID=1033252 RepID=A0AAD7JTZ5_9AGAR|nr:RNA polymerase III subunit RPC82-domain-containing protein [Mycena metata]
MADAQTARLCTQIIHSQFGPLTANVASVLLTRGRLTLPQIIRFTSLRPRTVRASVLVLVQHNVLWHAQTEEEGEVLEVNIEECLLRLRFGRFVWQAGQLFGEAGAEIVQLILDHGKLRPPDIISELSYNDPKGSSRSAATVYSQALHALVAAAYLKPSTILSHISPRDKRIRYEAEEKQKISGFPTAKELREAKESAAARLKREEEEAEKVGLKRKAKEQKGPRGTKRKAVEEEEVVDPTVYFRVNCDKFNIHIRNTLIVKAAKERFNDGAALVLKTTLKVTESKQKDLLDVRTGNEACFRSFTCSTDHTEPITVSSIAVSLSDQEDLSSGLILKTKNPSNTACIKDYLGVLSSADNPTPAGRAAAFLSYNSSKVQVEFETICKRLRRRVLESVTRERHDTQGVRILRLLLDTGKMDEKQISKVVMIPGKDVRPLLALMSAESLISTQEVPKSNDRNPARMFYLWHVDLPKAYSVILGNLYKTLYNIGVRRQAEQEEPMLKAVLAKRERSDVSQDEAALMSRMELDMIKEWEAKREKLTVLEMRAEESVFILRDLGVFGINDD